MFNWRRVYSNIIALFLIYQNHEIRKNLLSIILILTPYQFEKILLENLDKKNDLYCDEYISLLNKVSQTIRHATLEFLY